MKVKNVIIGLAAQYDLQEINIISQAESRVYYSGNLSGWISTSDIGLLELKRKIESKDVVDKIIFNNRKAFIFIPPIDAYCPAKDI